MTTDEILKGTVQTQFFWDGGTSVNQGVGYIIINCGNNLRRSRKSPLIITKRRYKDQALYKCSDYVKSKSDNN